VVAELRRPGRRRRLKGKPGRGTLAAEKPPILGMIQRNGEGVLQRLANGQQKTIPPRLKQTIQVGSLIFTDDYDIYGRLEEWGYQHKSVNHSAEEYARDEDGAGFQEGPVNTVESFGCLLRSWLRPHRGISQEPLPLHLTFFEFVHTIRRRGKALLGSLRASLLAP
jgi:transposase